MFGDESCIHSSWCNARSSTARTSPNLHICKKSCLRILLEKPLRLQRQRQYQNINFVYTLKKYNLYYSLDITSTRITSGGIHLRGIARGQHSSEKNNSGDEPLTTLRPIWPARESNPRLTAAPMVVSFTTTPSGQFHKLLNAKRCLSNRKLPKHFIPRIKTKLMILFPNSQNKESCMEMYCN